ncbi:thiol-disulfide oxidoreductase DCC family protein [Labrys sp. La1]|uniref:thiol-disulfide oxidoreductase DCC family protein n=1 Tax=Labrys sp. La1 TaxID=3404917 RepID=UPI003EB8884F
MNQWRPQPAGDLPDGLILFDGVCVLCSGMVAFVIPRDALSRFRFVAIQSEAGAVLADRFGIRADDPEAVAVISDGIAYFKADAAIAIGRGLPGWRWAVVLKAVPRPVRDFLYDRIARNRYRLFGKRESCLMPTPEIRARFIATLPDLASAA